MGFFTNLLKNSVSTYMTLDPLPPLPNSTEEFYTWCEAIERKVLFDPDKIDRKRQELTHKFKRPALMSDIKWALLLDKTLEDMKKGNILGYGRDKALGGRLLLGQKHFDDAMFHFLEYLYLMTTNDYQNSQGYLTGDEMEIMNMIRAYGKYDSEVIYRQSLKSGLLNKYVYRTKSEGILCYEWKAGIYTASIKF